ncbi:hypothetical protein LZ012_02145 [Dechloromonas sp. XY25]|uniref:Uncharacterized protein n=1 Tax=Dechloromonas hankyongensis TaxID=2908002 RepID=A0ABS9JY06_9RHOO|nr:hypothetical protein [Dechloromonas hankyongensis]MCG2575792.1 hypothetical protein [Dechloromonas hankyongensis]
MRSRQSGKWILGALIAVLAFGADAAPPKLLGLDDMSCPAWANTKANPDERQPYLAWARGFLSGHNYANQRQQVTDVSNGTIEQYADRYCRANPKASFADALYRMSDEFSGRGAALSK